MGKFIDLKNKKYNRLLVLERDFSKKRTFWICKCDCGKIVSVDASKLKSGHTKSCGCLNDENRKKHIEKLKTHNMRNTRLFGIWSSMRQRCKNKKSPAYRYYGGKGVEVCKEWDENFILFYEWSISNGYDEELTIDRIDVNGNYEPSNCRWADWKMQSNNRTNNHDIEYLGEIKTLEEWCEELNLKYCTIYHRTIVNKIPFEIAVKLPRFPKAKYKGKMSDLRIVSKIEKVNYKELIYLIFVKNMDAEKAINLIKTGG